MSTVLLVLSMVCSLVGTVGGIMILIAAFQDEVVQGILCLCVPCYILYYAFARYQSENKQLALMLWLGGGILGAVLQGIAVAMAEAPGL